MFRIDGTKVMQTQPNDKCHMWNNLLPELNSNLRKQKFLFIYINNIYFFNFDYNFRSNIHFKSLKYI